MKVTAHRVSLAPRRAEKRSVIRRAALESPGRLKRPQRWMADNGLRPLPPYASFIIAGAASLRT